ncbi:MAG: ABC transporter ATP-binding protein, partial [Pseudomonadota bacterium]
MNRPEVASAAETDADYAAAEEAHGLETRKIGGVVMDIRNITLRFGGVTAIKDI